MTEVRIVSVTFNNRIEPWEVTKFRGGIIKKVGIEHEWFHNHNNDKNADYDYHYRYPLIQYRYHNGNPQLTCIQHGVEEVQQLFSKADWDIRIGRRIEKLGIKELKVKAVSVDITEDMQYYQLQHWLPFNSKNYKHYQTLDGLIPQLQFLQKILTGHILGFAQGIGWEVGEQLEVSIQKIVKQKFITYKRTKMLAFNLDFAVNARLPYQAALGQGVSLGFGLLKKGFGK